MRDIRNDLQERAGFIGEQIKAAQAQFETVLEQLKREHEGRVKDLRSELDAVKTLLAIEQRRHPGAPAPAQSQPQPMPQPQSQPQVAKAPRPLSDILMRRAG